MGTTILIVPFILSLITVDLTHRNPASVQTVRDTDCDQKLVKWIRCVMEINGTKACGMDGAGARYCPMTGLVNVVINFGGFFLDCENYLKGLRVDKISEEGFS